MERESEKEKERVHSRASVSQQSRSAGIPETGMGRKQLTCSKCSQHTHQPEASQILVEYKKCNASSWNLQAADLTALLAVSVTQNSECVRLGIPRWHCVQGAAGTGVCCSHHSRKRECQLSRACRQATTYHSHEETQQVRAATRSLHVRRASHEEGSGTGASHMQLPPLVAPAPNPSHLPACSFKAHQGAPYEDPATASRAATHRSVLLHQSEWV